MNENGPGAGHCGAAGEDAKALRLRSHGAPTLPTLIYLPGLHGDWTLVASFRRAVQDRVRFVEFTYPRTLTWTLEQYAEAIERALLEHDIHRGWILAESFGSQVAWPLLTRGGFRAEGLILAGGFVQHPVRLGVRLAERLAGGLSLGIIAKILFGYAKLARWRYRKSPEVLGSIDEFIARRTELDRQAAKHRLRLLGGSDFRAVARQVDVPVFALSGLIDPIVPWFLVRPWLRRHCPALRDFRIIPVADHNVLGTATEPAARQILKWISR